MTLPKSTIKQYLPLLLLLLIGICVIFYRFLSIPKNTTFDEVEFAKLAIQLGKQSYTPYSVLATGHATLYFYIILFSIKLFGISLFALRLPSAIFGVLNPLILFLILKKIFKEPLSFLLVVVFITLRWYFNFARFGFEATFLLFLELCSIYYLFNFFEKKHPKHLVLSGIFAGLAYNSYQPGRIFFVIPLFILIMMKLLHRPSIHRFKPFLFFFIPFFILILPLTIYLNLNHDTRFYQQFYPDNHEMTIREKKDFFVRNVVSTIGIFNIKGDVNGRHNYPNKPALNPILGILYIAGLVLALKNIKKRNNQLFLIWFFLSLAPTLVTYPWENPNMLRTFTVIPPLIYFIGIVIEKIVSLPIFRKPLIKKMLLGCIISLFILSSYYELRTYFVHQAKVFEEAFEADRELILYINPHAKDK